MADLALSPQLEEIIKKTIDYVGRIVKTKPPLTPKLLSKPPFRYLHDLFSEMIRSTGFASDLYEESEMNSDNIKVFIENESYLAGRWWKTKRTKEEGFEFD